MFDVVIANKNITRTVKKGFRGTILEILEPNNVFLVEFFNQNGDNIEDKDNGVLIVGIQDIDLLIKYNEN